MFIDDEIGLLNPTQLSVLNNLASKADVKIVISSSRSRAELDGATHNLVNTPNTLAIGIDPIHKYTFTHFGSGLAIPSADFKAIATSGNLEFKAGRWAEGVTAIVHNADAEIGLLRTVSSTTPVIVQQPVIEHPVSAVPFVIGGLLVMLIGYVIWRLLNKKAKETEQVLSGFRDEAAELRSRNIKEAAYYNKIPETVKPLPETVTALPNDRNTREMFVAKKMNVKPTKTYVRPQRPVVRTAPATVIVQGNNNSGNDLVTGMVIGSMMNQPREVIRERSVTPAPSRSSSYDSGSSSSSYDSGSSSYDSGSSGGGFDSGGGGFDSGSSGGDF